MELADLIRRADDDELIWALLIEHEDANLELHNHEHEAMIVFDRPATEQGMAEWLLVPEPVACGEAARAGVDLLGDCPRCSAP